MQLSMDVRYPALVCVATFLTFVDGFSFRRQMPQGGSSNCCGVGQTCRDASTCCDPDITEPKIRFNPYYRKLTLVCEECCPEGAVRSLSWTGNVKRSYCPVLKCCNPDVRVAAVQIDEQREMFQLACVKAAEIHDVFPAGEILVDGRIGYSVKSRGPITCDDSMPTYQSMNGYLVLKCA